MGNLGYREFYRRHLPHFQPRGFGFFITFRLANSLPAEVVDKLVKASQIVETALTTVPTESDLFRQMQKDQQKHFEAWDDALHLSKFGPHDLDNNQIAGIVAESIRHHDGQWFDLEAFCIMPNHVHLVLIPKAKSETVDYSLAEIMHNIKRNSAKRANVILGRSGEFWQHESYDHVIRDRSDLEHIVQYVLYNPVKAGLVTDWQAWNWSYSTYELSS